MLLALLGRLIVLIVEQISLLCKDGYQTDSLTVSRYVQIVLFKYQPCP